MSAHITRKTHFLQNWHEIYLVIFCTISQKTNSDTNSHSEPCRTVHSSAKSIETKIRFPSLTITQITIRSNLGDSKPAQTVEEETKAVYRRGKPVLLLWVGWCARRESDAPSITVTPEGGVTDEGDAIGAETAEHGTTQRAGREEDTSPAHWEKWQRRDTSFKGRHDGGGRKGALCGWQRPEESLLCGDKLRCEAPGSRATGGILKMAIVVPGQTWI